MKLKDGQRIFYDACLDAARIRRDQFRVLFRNAPIGPGFLLKRGEGHESTIDSSTVLEGLEKRVQVLEDSHVFLIDGATADSLYYVNHQRGNYPERIYLPFPRMFFEFEVPVEQKKERGPPNIKAVMFSKFTDSALVIVPPKDEEDQRRITESYFAELLENNPEKASFQNPGIIFRVNELPNFTYGDWKGNVEVDYSAGEVKTVDNPFYTGISKDTRLEVITRKVEEVDEEDHIRRYADFVVNLLDLINAENIVIRRSWRERGDLDKVNRKREKKGKRPLPPLKPYYWLEVKKSYVASEPTGEGKELEYRVWVRAHHQHYYTTEGLIRRWIECYIKGPVNAPWKHHRYAVLYKNFRHLLSARGNEEIRE